MHAIFANNHVLYVTIVAHSHSPGSDKRTTTNDASEQRISWSNIAFAKSTKKTYIFSLQQQLIWGWEIVSWLHMPHTQCHLIACSKDAQTFNSSASTCKNKSFSKFHYFFAEWSEIKKKRKNENSKRKEKRNKMKIMTKKSCKNNGKIIWRKRKRATR